MRIQLRAFFSRKQDVMTIRLVDNEGRPSGEQNVPVTIFEELLNGKALMITYDLDAKTE